jgi:ferredoxin
MRKFDTKVQYLKYKVLREVARLAWEDKLLENLIDIPKRLVPGNEPTMRCCVYKERAILGERVKLAMGGDKNNPNVIEVIEIACDECPVGGFEVTNACRGCLAHRCEDVCKFGAITFDQNHVAHIDKTKCKECGACAKVCQRRTNGKGNCGKATDIGRNGNRDGGSACFEKPSANGRGKGAFATLCRRYSHGRGVDRKMRQAGRIQT